MTDTYTLSLLGVGLPCIAASFYMMRLERRHQLESINGVYRDYRTATDHSSVYRPISGNQSAAAEEEK